MIVRCATAAAVTAAAVPGILCARTKKLNALLDARCG